jgi:hypothetical protein
MLETSKEVELGCEWQPIDGFRAVEREDEIKAQVQLSSESKATPTASSFLRTVVL